MQETKKYQFKDNPFPVLFCDVTKACNMNCNVCYSQYDILDIDTDYLDKALEQFPKKNVHIILVGGEPTVSPHFFDYLKIINKHGHLPYISTNGKRIGEDDLFAKELANYCHENRVRIHIPISGGTDPELNAIIFNDEDAYKFKIKALDNLQYYGVDKVAISVVLIKGINEHVIKEIFELGDKYKDIVQALLFRSQASLGDYIPQDKHYSTNEFLNYLLLNKLATKKDFSRVFSAGWLYPQCEGRNCCYKFLQGKRYIEICEVLTQPCWMRGKIGNNQPFVENLYEGTVDQLGVSK